MALTIGKVARSSGVPARTIRFYESRGVLRPPGRTNAGYRLYRQDDVGQLVFVRRARGLGLSLEQLKALTATLNGAVRGSVRPHLREAVRSHLVAVQQRIGELHLLERQIRRVLRRMDTAGSPRVTGQCRCLDPEDSSRPSTHNAKRRR
jgi:DNA-binding transcriptional MerR regulator